MQESGVDFYNNGRIINCCGTISIVSADNLASWSIDGYKTLSSARRKCCFCMATAEEIQSKVHFINMPDNKLYFQYMLFLFHVQFSSDDYKPRTRETHGNHCRDLDGPLHDHIETTYGLDCNSFLKSLQFFHVTDGLSPDIMHDVLEGGLEYEAKELLKYLTDQKHLDAHELNGRIEAFPYGYADAVNKPSILSDTTLKSPDHSLKQTGSKLLVNA